MREDRATATHVALVRSELERYARLGVGLARREAVRALEESSDDGPDRSVRWYDTSDGNRRVRFLHDSKWTMPNLYV